MAIHTKDAGLLACIKDPPVQHTGMPIEQVGIETPMPSSEAPVQYWTGRGLGPAYVHTVQPIPDRRVMVFDWVNTPTVDERALLCTYSIPEYMPLDMYLEFRTQHNQPPVTDVDFARLHEHVHTALELIYEGMGLDDNSPAFDYPALTTMLVAIVPAVVNIAYRWGSTIEGQFPTYATGGPEYAYVIDSAQQRGHNGLFAEFEELHATDHRDMAVPGLNINEDLYPSAAHTTRP